MKKQKPLPLPNKHMTLTYLILQTDIFSKVFFYLNNISAAHSHKERSDLNSKVLSFAGSHSSCGAPHGLICSPVILQPNASGVLPACKSGSGISAVFCTLARLMTSCTEKQTSCACSDKSRGL